MKKMIVEVLAAKKAAIVPSLLPTPRACFPDILNYPIHF